MVELPIMSGGAEPDSTPTVLTRLAPTSAVCRLDLRRLAEAERRVRDERVSVSGEDPGPAEADQRPAHVGQLDPTLDGTDAIDFGDRVGVRGSTLATRDTRVAGLEHEVSAESERRVHAAERGVPVIGFGDRLADVAGHRHQIGCQAGKGGGVAVDPPHPVGAGIGSGHCQRASRWVDAGHLQAAAGQQ